MGKSKTKFKRVWLTEFAFLKQDSKDDGKAFCTFCNSSFGIIHGGKNDITAHIKTDRHRRGQQTIADNSKNPVTSYFQSTLKGPTDDQMKISAQELAFCYHTAKHNLSLRANECNSKLVKEMFQPKYTCSKTKTSTIVQKVIAPHLDKGVRETLSLLNFLTILTDTSNRKYEKLLPVVIRGFSLTIGIVHYKLALKKILNETSITIKNELIETGKIFKLFRKAIPLLL